MVCFSSLLCVKELVTSEVLDTCQFSPFLYYTFVGPSRRAVTAMVRMFYLLPLFISGQEFDNFGLPGKPITIKSFENEVTEINSFVLMQEILFVCFANAA